MPRSERLLTDAALALRPGRGRRSPWLREALADEGDPPPAHHWSAIRTRTWRSSVTGMPDCGALTSCSRAGTKGAQ